MPTIENYNSYAPWAYDVLHHGFAFTTAAFLAGLVYFLMTAKNVSKRYRLASIISAVVMVSATLEIGQLWLLWGSAFQFDEASNRFVVTATERFSNGYRYVNWLIDVPMLMTQLVVVCGLTGAALARRWALLSVLGAGMIITGYIGQFYESAAAGAVAGATAPFWVWGAISTIFFVALLLVLAAQVRRPLGDPSPQVRRNLIICFWFLLATWSIYPFGYLWPVIDGSSGGVVVRQLLYTVADISSKLAFGVFLGFVAERRSRDDEEAAAN